MQGPWVPSQQRGQNPTEPRRHAPERSRGNPTASKTAAPDPSRQNSPDRSRRQNLRSLHLPILQVLPVGVRQESHRSCHFPNLSLRISSPMPNQYLVQMATTPPDQLSVQERELLHTWKKAIYEDVLRTVKHVSDWLLFKDKQDLPKVLRALTRRDLSGIMQAVQTSPRFYAICVNCGLFDVEPLLWDMIWDEIQAGQKNVGGHNF